MQHVVVDKCKTEDEEEDSSGMEGGEAQKHVLGRC